LTTVVFISLKPADPLRWLLWLFLSLCGDGLFSLRIQKLNFIALGTLLDLLLLHVNRFAVKFIQVVEVLIEVFLLLLNFDLHLLNLLAALFRCSGCLTRSCGGYWPIHVGAECSVTFCWRWRGVVGL
jgi:hypothetical protein